MSLTASAESHVFPLGRTFTIARSSRDEQAVVHVQFSDGEHRGRGESVPTRHYGESIDSVLKQIRSVLPALCDADAPLDTLQQALPAGAARNAIDCALWDLEAKRTGRRVWELLDRTEPEPIRTVDTVSLDEPEVMAAAAARSFSNHPLLKVKLGADRPFERIAAVRAAVPKAQLVIDANEAWTLDELEALAPRLADLDVEWIEQPLRAGQDEALAEYACPLPLVADESCHTRADLDACEGRYDAVNVKLDKTGGLTEALALVREARTRGFEIMVGCMVCTSLGIAPATLLTHGAVLVDLDGPTWLADDPEPRIEFQNSFVLAPDRALWG